MLILVLGGILIGVALIWFFYKLYVSFSSAGGTAFEVPVYDAAIYPPVMGTVGAFLVNRHLEIGWPFWVYLLIWLGTALLFAGAIRGMEEIGDRPLR